ncbi:anti-sigma factor family protein [Altericista sp. CCNU0014]|uniref:anti-sigma factor family protein n=1 Tax=Altericista sp. CCNU0014 TaxID=3082949 RepID=UPI00384DD042
MDTSTSLFSEKFELLSAYMDGEVSPVERQQVEEWLASDAELQRTYQQMLALQSGLKTMPAVAPSIPTEQLVNRVMQRLDRQQQPKVWIWGGLGAATALLVGALSGLLSGGNQGGMFQTAQQPQAPSVTVPLPDASSTVAMRPAADAKTLMIVLERPPVAIPVVPAPGSDVYDDSSTSNF